MPRSCLRIVLRDLGPYLSKKGWVRKLCGSANPWNSDTSEYTAPKYPWNANVCSLYTVPKPLLDVPALDYRIFCPEHDKEKDRASRWPRTSQELHACVLCHQGSGKGRNYPFTGQGKGQGIKLLAQLNKWQRRALTHSAPQLPKSRQGRTGRRALFESKKNKEGFSVCLWFSRGSFIWWIVGILLMNDNETKESSRSVTLNVLEGVLWQTPTPAGALDAGVKFKINCIQTSWLLCSWTEGIKNGKICQLGCKLDSFFFCIYFIEFIVFVRRQTWSYMDN